ncbi:MAG TPA: ABC transporter permease subunit [Bryobacteraceae bacterium]|jgi:ABC-type transport system involved in multi-copper enzyme maturation permease subunit|nr:ABC transporter permease subunit [Bryobacteraceae bacterium]
MSTQLEKSNSAVLFALIADTFEEARARWLFWGLFGLSTLLICLFLFALNIDLAQGAVSFMDVQSTTRPIYDIRKFVNVSYSWVSIFLYIWGTFLAIFASSGLIPSVLEAGRISLLLSKPVSRSTLLFGRYLGNLLVVTANHVYLIGCIWIILGLKTHIWEPRFLLAIPISLFMFAVLLSAVVYIGVRSESSALSVMVAVAIMLISTILAQRDNVIRLLSSQWSRELWLMFYWIVPKVYDLGTAMKQIILFDREANWFTPVWTSALFGIVTLLASIRLFRRRDF